MCDHPLKELGGSCSVCPHQIPKRKMSAAGVGSDVTGLGTGSSTREILRGLAGSQQLDRSANGWWER